MEDLKLFLEFGKNYCLTKIISAAKNFEAAKDIVVAFLTIKRGRYSSSFLNTSFFLIVLAALVAGPTIAENSPFFKGVAESSSQASLVSYNPYQGSLGTTVSVKPQIVDYQVLGGDTLASIAKKFNISVDSIKWSNDLRNDLIKPGQLLKIPPENGVVYKVASGDTVYSIAKKYNVNAQNIVNFPMNDFADMDTFALSIGQYLFVPGGEILPEKAAPRFVATIQAGVRGTSNFIWPTSGVITQYPVWYHMALDIANPSTPAVLAADSGTVTYAGCLTWGYGCHVIIDHGNGYQTLYTHLSRYNIEPGDAVSQGSQIGVMGSTGMSTGTHLHFEIRSGGTLLNPLNFLK
jgi:murein DD-endopeptidase MepM/ murein hydrolase activator NlpD